MRNATSAISAALAWFGPGSRAFDLVRIYFVSLIILLFYLYYGDIRVENGATDYIELAKAIVAGASVKGYIQIYGRDIGMALIWLASGFPLSQSLTGVIFIQAMMALAMPLLGYLTLRPWFPRTAYFTALTVVLSLSPFLMFKTIHHDLPYIFFLILSLYLVNRYMLTRAPSSLYAVAASIFCVGLMRLTGQGMFWLLLPVLGLRGGRRAWPQLVIATLLFVAASVTYAKYREMLIGERPAAGMILFQNLYINSSELGVTISEHDGPVVKSIIKRVRACSLPSSREATKYVRAWWDNPPESVLTENFYNFTPDQLVDNVFSHPSIIYSFFISSCVENTSTSSDNVESGNPAELDHVLMRASAEIALSHPIFVMELFFRNSFQLLYDPGWLHGQIVTGPEFRGGLQFPFGGITTAGRANVNDARLPEPALSEAGFVRLAREPEFIKRLYFAIEETWYASYHPATVIAGCLAWFAWISTAIGVLNYITRRPRIARWAQLWHSEAVIRSSSAITVLLLANVAITALFVEPYYRYDFSLLELKVLLAGVGCAVAIGLARSSMGVFSERKLADLKEANDGGFVEYADTEKYRRYSLIYLSVGAGILFVTGALAWLIQAKSTTPDEGVNRTVLKATAVRELPQLPPPMDWDLVWGLEATQLNNHEAPSGQIALRLTAIPSNDPSAQDRHGIALKVGELAPAGTYRIEAWLKASPGQKVQFQVRDSIMPGTGSARNYGEARFDLSSGTTISATGDLRDCGAAQATNGWTKVWGNLTSADGSVFLYIGLLERGSDSHVFKGSGEEVLLGGITVTRVQLDR